MILDDFQESMEQSFDSGMEEVQVGINGLSAYEIAVKNGFKGTEQEWLDSLEGPQGPQGEPGPAGPQGEPGPDSENVQSDLTQNDETADDYVKGRTHWSEYEEVTFIDNETVVADEELDFVVPKGTVLNVTYNGVEYVRETKEYDVNGDGDMYVLAGNLSIVGFGDDNGDPFIFASFPSQGYSIFIFQEDETAQIQLKGKLETVHAIPQKYINSTYIFKTIYDSESKKYTTSETVENIKNAILENVNVVGHFGGVTEGMVTLLPLFQYSVDFKTVRFGHGLFGSNIIFGALDGETYEYGG